ncbi:MAG: hypothetical protein DHS20C18_28020 [Saprospiraceae bacterium]|nr:MAG: hypothetical protein DHS20C18_28020 [Saprospiraceae bacterium]
MFIPPPNFKPPEQEKEQSKGFLRLKASHLQIDHEIVEQIFGDDHNAYAVYYADKKSLLLAPVSDELFKKLHKASQHMLKDRNLKGDKAIALHEMIIDNQLDDTDRELNYELQPGLGILNVKL